jgi:hypothetical protein
VERTPDAVTAELADEAEPFGLGDGFDRVADVGEPGAGPDLGDRRLQRDLRRLDETFRFCRGRHAADEHRHGGIGVEALPDRAEVE